MPTQSEWMNKAALYELLGKCWAYPTEELAGVAASGELADMWREVAQAGGVSSDEAVVQAALLDAYRGRDQADLLDGLRREYTRLFIYTGSVVVQPYAGMWYAQEHGVPVTYMIGKESMAIERFMRRCGVGQPEGTNEPLDHIASLAEFLYLLCLIGAGAVKPAAHPEVRPDDYDVFFREHFAPFAHAFAKNVTRETADPLFVAAARLLGCIVG